MPKKIPLVSVIMSVRNGERYVTYAIESILKQTFTDFEFIIIDDASLDKTKSIVNKYKDPRIRLLINNRKRGLTGSLNKALKIAKGKYIARMDYDDIARKDRFKKQVEFLENNQNIGVLGSFVMLIDENNHLKRIMKFPVRHKAIIRDLMMFNPIRHSTVIFRKNLIIEYGFYDDKLDGAEDYDLWLRLAKYTQLANLNLPLLKYRVHKGSVSEKEEQKVLKAAIKARIKAIIKYNYPVFDFVYVIFPCISYFVPKKLKNLWRR